MKLIARHKLHKKAERAFNSILRHFLKPTNALDIFVLVQYSFTKHNILLRNF